MSWKQPAFHGVVALGIIGALYGAYFLVVSPHTGTRTRMRNDRQATPPTEPVTNQRPATRLPTNEPVALQTPEQVIADSARLDRLRQAHLRLLTDIAAGDPDGDRLIAFLRDHAIYSVLVGGGVTHMVVSRAQAHEDSLLQGMGDPHGFELTEATTEERRRNGLTVLSALAYDPNRNELFLPPLGTFDRMLVAALLAHELTHAYDYAYRVEEPSSFTSDDWQRGELRAYRIEFRLLDRALHGRLVQAVDHAISLFGSHLPQPPSSCFGPNDMEPWITHEFDNLLATPTNREEQTLRYTIWLLAMNDRLVERQNAGEAGHIACLRYVMRFNGTFQDTP